MKSRILTGLMFFAIIANGCGILGDNDNNLKELIPPEEELIPLEVGNYWVYEQWYMNPEWKDTVREEVLNVQNIIAENTKIRAYGTYRFHYKERPREDALIWLKANGPKGFYSLGGKIPSDSLFKLSNGLYYKYPATLGDTWENTAVLYNPQIEEMTLGNMRTIELVDTTKTIVTPAETFTDCYVYKHNDFRSTSTLVHYFYIKPMIGVVGVDTYVADDKNDQYGQMRLLEYKLK